VSARKNAEDELRLRGHGEITALRGIGYALLDLADAIREHNAPKPIPPPPPRYDPLPDPTIPD
jgi:hypothetical protein